MKEFISLLSLKRISWCGSRGMGETEREKTKAQLLLHRMKEKDQLSVQSVPLGSMISQTIRDASLNLELMKPKCTTWGHFSHKAQVSDRTFVGGVVQQECDWDLFFNQSRRDIVAFSPIIVLPKCKYVTEITGLVWLWNYNQALLYATLLIVVNKIGETGWHM